ncbi:MAG TPA: sodium/proline symporter PutP [Anaerolineae bacterium]|nr:sodium/proline symporter PutP [Anaerolineae bacterium]
MSDPTILSFVLYLVGMIAIGVVAWRMTRTLSDFVLGGRRLGGVVTALSAGASGMSGWLLLGLPGAFYLLGLNQIWIAIGLSTGAYLNWSIVSPRLRRFSERADNALTLSDYFEVRFDDRSRLLRIACASVTLIFFTIYTASGLVSGAVLFSATFGASYQHALWLCAAMIVSYTFLGGFLAVSWTDVVQGLLMLIALVMVPVAAIQELGGWEATTSQIGSFRPGHLSAFSDLTALSTVSLLAWGLGYFGQPHILARFMAMKSAREMPTARAVGMWWMIVSLYGAMISGFVAVAYFQATPLDNPETAFISLTRALFNPWISGLFLAAVLAAIMSTADSQLIVAASALTEDLYRPFVRQDAGERELIWVGRTGLMAIALLALLIGGDPKSRVLDIVAYAWAGFGAGFGPALLLSLTWRRMTRNGALAGMVAGAVTVVAWANLDSGIFEVYEILPGFVMSVVAIVFVSLCDPPPLAASRFFDD